MLFPREYVETSTESVTGRVWRTFIIMDHFSLHLFDGVNLRARLLPTHTPIRHTTPECKPKAHQCLCVCVSLSPPADGGEVPPHVEQRNGQLHFTKVTRSDAGNYTCIASNSLQGEIRAMVTLTVAGKALAHHPRNRKLREKGSQ